MPIAALLHDFATRPVAPLVTGGIEWHLKRPTTLDVAGKGSAGLLATGTGGSGRASSADPVLSTFRLVCAAVTGACKVGEPVEPLSLVMDAVRANPAAGVLFVGDIPAPIFNALAGAVVAIVSEGGDVLDCFLGGDVGAGVDAGPGRGDGSPDGPVLGAPSAGSGDSSAASA